MSLVKKTLAEMIPWTRTSGGTYDNAAGNLVGIDIVNTGAQAATTGTKNFTVPADRGWQVDDDVRIVPSDFTANMAMIGKVVSYNPTTGALVCNITSTGSDTTTTKSTWRIGFSGNRIDHDFDTIGTRHGFLVEPQRNNLLRNNTNQGAVVGVIGSGGVLPTNWSTNSGHGLAVTVVAVGVERGVTYCDIRINGTVSASPFELFFDTTTGMTVAEGNLCSAGAYYKVVGGTQTGITGITQSITQNESTGTFITRADYAISPTGTLKRYELQHTVTDTTPNTARAQLSLRFGLTVSAAVDITVRIGFPQFEVGMNLSSPIPTTGGNTSRSADIPLVADFATWAQNLSNEYTIYAKVRLPSNIDTSLATSPRAFMLTDSGGTNQMRLYVNASARQAVLQGSVGGTTEPSISYTGTIAVLTSAKMAARVRNNDHAISRDGGAVSTDVSTPPGLPPGMTEARVGIASSGSGHFCGHIQEIGFIPRGLSNSELQAKST